MPKQIRVVHQYKNMLSLEATRDAASRFSAILAADKGWASEVVPLIRGNGHRVVCDHDELPEVRMVDFLVDEDG